MRMKFIVHAEEETKTPDIREISLGVYAVEAEDDIEAVRKVSNMLLQAAAMAVREGLVVDPNPIPSLLPSAGEPNIRVYRHTTIESGVEFVDIQAASTREACELVEKLNEGYPGAPQINWTEEYAPDVDYMYRAETLQDVVARETDPEFK
jgi:hypothetical protein